MNSELENGNAALMVEKVLDHGFVEVVEILGSDQSIVNAARTSYDKGTKKVSNTRQLIRYLMRHKHMGPFEFGEIVFRIRCPLFVARQWFRHRTGSYNEASLRYSEARDEFYLPKPEWITGQDKRNKQVRTKDELASSHEIREKMEKEARNLIESYNGYIESGVAREIARINLPLSYYTTFCFKSDIRNLLNFLSLRTDIHAQFEIRQYAEIMLGMTEKYFPLIIEAWRDFHKQSITFSRGELNIIDKMFQKSKFDVIKTVKEYFESPVDEIKLSISEKKEFVDKLLILIKKETTLNFL